MYDDHNMCVVAILCNLWLLYPIIFYMLPFGIKRYKIITSDLTAKSVE